MNENDIKIGDVVSLKSGSPKMTVREFKEYTNIKIAICDWFDVNTHQQSGFPTTSLIKKD